MAIEIGINLVGEQQITAAILSIDNMEKSLVSLSTMMNEQVASSKKLEVGLATLNTQMIAAQSGTAGLIASNTALSASINNIASTLSAEIAALSAAAVATAESTTSTNSNTAAVTRNVAVNSELQAALRGTAGALGGLWLSYGNIVPMMAAFATAASVKNIQELGVQFEYLTQYAYSLSDTSVSLASIRTELLAMKGVAQTPEALAGGFLELQKAGYGAAESMTALETLSKYAAVSEQDLAKSVQQLVTIFNAYKDTSLDAVGNNLTLASTADIIAAAAQGSVVSFQEMQTALRYTTALSSTAQLGLTDVSAALMVMGDAGLGGSIGATAMRTALVKMLDPSDKFTKMLAAAGIEMKKFASGDEILNLREMFAELNRIKNTVTDEQWAKISKEGFGMRGELITAAITDLSKYDAAVRKLGESANFVTSVFNDLEKTTKFMAIELKSSFDTALTEAFNSESAKKILSSLTEAVKSEEFKGAISDIMGLVYELGKALAWLAKDGTENVELLITVFGLLRLAMWATADAAAAAAASSTAAAAATPWGKIAIVVIAANEGLKELHKTVDEMPDMSFSGMKAAGSEFVSVISTMVGMVRGFNDVSTGELIPELDRIGNKITALKEEQDNKPFHFFGSNVDEELARVDKIQDAIDALKSKYDTLYKYQDIFGSFASSSLSAPSIDMTSIDSGFSASFSKIETGFKHLLDGSNYSLDNSPFQQLTTQSNNLGYDVKKIGSLIDENVINPFRQGFDFSLFFSGFITSGEKAVQTVEQRLKIFRASLNQTQVKEVQEIDALLEEYGKSQEERDAIQLEHKIAAKREALTKIAKDEDTAAGDDANREGRLQAALDEERDLGLAKIHARYEKKEARATESNQKLLSLTSEMEAFIANSDNKTLATQVENINKQYNARVAAITKDVGTEEEKNTALIAAGKERDIKLSKAQEDYNAKVTSIDKELSNQLIDTGNVTYDQKLAKINSYFNEYTEKIRKAGMSEVDAEEETWKNYEVFFKKKEALDDAELKRKEKMAATVALFDDSIQKLSLSSGVTMQDDLSKALEKDLLAVKTLRDELAKKGFAADVFKEEAAKLDELGEKIQNLYNTRNGNDPIEALKLGLKEAATATVPVGKAFEDLGKTIYNTFSKDVASAISDIGLHLIKNDWANKFTSDMETVSSKIKDLQYNDLQDGASQLAWLKNEYSTTLAGAMAGDQKSFEAYMSNLDTYLAKAKEEMSPEEYSKLYAQTMADLNKLNENYASQTEGVWSTIKKAWDGMLDDMLKSFIETIAKLVAEWAAKAVFNLVFDTSTASTIGNFIGSLLNGSSSSGTSGGSGSTGGGLVTSTATSAAGSYLMDNAVLPAYNYVTGGTAGQTVWTMPAADTATATEAGQAYEWGSGWGSGAAADSGAVAGAAAGSETAGSVADFAAMDTVAPATEAGSGAAAGASASWLPAFLITWGLTESYGKKLDPNERLQAAQVNPTQIAAVAGIDTNGTLAQMTYESSKALDLLDSSLGHVVAASVDASSGVIVLAKSVENGTGTLEWSTQIYNNATGVWEYNADAFNLLLDQMMEMSPTTDDAIKASAEYVAQMAGIPSIADELVIAFEMAQNGITTFAGGTSDAIDILAAAGRHMADDSMSSADAMQLAFSEITGGALDSSSAMQAAAALTAGNISGAADVIAAAMSYMGYGTVTAAGTISAAVGQIEDTAGDFMTTVNGVLADVSSINWGSVASSDATHDSVAAYDSDNSLTGSAAAVAAATALENYNIAYGDTWNEGAKANGGWLGLALGGWLGSNPNGGVIRRGSGVRDDVFLGKTNGGAISNFGMGGEFVVNRQSSATYAKELEDINNDRSGKNKTSDSDSALKSTLDEIKMIMLAVAKSSQLSADTMKKIEYLGLPTNMRG